MATASPPRSSVDRKLTLREVMDWLVEDGMVSKDDAGKVLQDARYTRGNKHPFMVVGEARLRSLVAPNNPLQPEALTQWLAARMKLPYYHIDPL